MSLPLARSWSDSRYDGQLVAGYRPIRLGYFTDARRDRVMLPPPVNITLNVTLAGRCEVPLTKGRTRDKRRAIEWIRRQNPYAYSE